MRELPYRFEEKKAPDETTHSYIVKDVQVEGQKTKVYIPIDPSITIRKSNANKIKAQYALEIERKPIEKSVELYTGKYLEMVAAIAALLCNQYSDILQSNLKKLVIPVKEKSQKRLNDYFSV
jgi:hypothetical protein